MIKTLNEKLQQIKQFVISGEIKDAEMYLTFLLNGTDPEWVSKFCHIEDTLRIFKYIKTIQITDHPNACINLLSQEMQIGKKFLVDIHSPIDLLFVVYHERNHILCNKLYKLFINDLVTQFKRKYVGLDNQIDTLANHAEEIYVNGMTYRVLKNKRFLTSTFGTEGYSSLRSGSPDTEYWAKYPDIMCYVKRIFNPNLFGRFVHWTEVYITNLLTISNNTEQLFEDVEEQDDIFSSGTPITIKQTTGYTKQKEQGRNSIGRSISLDKKTFPNTEDALDQMVLDTSTDATKELKVYKLQPKENNEIIEVFGTIFSEYNINNNMYYEGRSACLPHRLTRRDQYQVQGGNFPLMYSRKYFPKVSTKQYVTYFDVSGSMSNFLGVLPLIQQQMHHLVKQHYCFSSMVVEADPTFTHYLSSGGTSFNGVATHIFKIAATQIGRAHV